MNNIKVEYSWLKNSAITGVNQLPEHSEHYYFDKYVGINQLDCFQIDKMHLNSNWTYMKSDFNEKRVYNKNALLFVLLTAEARPRPMQHSLCVIFISPTGARTLIRILFAGAIRVGFVVNNLIEGNRVPNSARP